MLSDRANVGLVSSEQEVCTQAASERPASERAAEHAGAVRAQDAGVSRPSGDCAAAGAPDAPAASSAPGAPGASDAPGEPGADCAPSVDSPRIDPSATGEGKLDEGPSRGQRVKDFALDKTPEKLKNPSDLQVRLRTGFLYIAITSVCLLTGNIPTAVMLSVTAGICAGEFFYMLRQDAKLPNEALGIIGAVLYPPSVLVGGLSGAVVVSVLLMLALLVWYVFWQRARIGDVAVSYFGAMYTGLLLASVMFIRMRLGNPWGGVLAWGIFVSIWICDGFAYLVGRKIGKHKMAPHVSPKKSWEGFFAGELMCAVAWIGISFIPGVSIGVPLAVLVGFVVGIAGVLGDLVESRIKRNSGVKDSGTLMPGHGGLLDRSDSMFLAAVVAAALLVPFGCI